jgi:dephospho-CoA kinase
MSGTILFGGQGHKSKENFSTGEFTMLIVGLTGGIASGKSTVAEMFEREGGYILDTDSMSREVVEPDTPGWHEVVSFFGKEILNQDRTLNRKKLGDIVFSDPRQRKKLEAMLHPKIYERKKELIGAIVDRDTQAILIIAIPLLIEVNSQDTVDKIVLVYVSPQVQLARLMARDGFSTADAQKRVASQMPIDSKLKYAHYVINNEGPLEKTQQAVRDVFKGLKEAEVEKRAQGKQQQ